MKKLLIALMAVTCMQVAVADDAAKIKIRISGAAHDNRYFLCLPNVGCLSILAAARGKVYPIYRPVEISGLYVTDVNNNFRVTSQGLPNSCDVTVQPNQTITISGKISVIQNNTAMINGLHCSVA